MKTLAELRDLFPKLSDVDAANALKVSKGLKTWEDVCREYGVDVTQLITEITNAPENGQNPKPEDMIRAILYVYSRNHPPAGDSLIHPFPGPHSS